MTMADAPDIKHGYFHWAIAPHPYPPVSIWLYCVKGCNFSCCFVVCRILKIYFNEKNLTAIPSKCPAKVFSKYKWTLFLSLSCKAVYKVGRWCRIVSILVIIGPFKFTQPLWPVRFTHHNQCNLVIISANISLWTIVQLLVKFHYGTIVQFHYGTLVKFHLGRN